MEIRSDNLAYLADTVQASIPRIVDLFEVGYVTLHLFRAGRDAQNKPYVRTNYPDAWISRYLLNDYVRIDPVLQMAETTTAPFCWSKIGLRPESLNMMEQAAEYGVGPTGFSLVHVDAIGRRSVLSFNAAETRGGETWEPFLEENSDHLAELSAELHRMAVAEISGGDAEAPQLSPRERECLRWTAAGKAHTDIAIILNLSEHTVRSYLKDARIKLDSATLAQAVSKASALGLI
ncbi:MAG: autoinducer binding domain-containing protein [Pseudomonadota bacterium]